MTQLEFDFMDIEKFTHFSNQQYVVLARAWAGLRRMSVFASEYNKRRDVIHKAILLMNAQQQCDLWCVTLKEHERGDIWLSERDYNDVKEVITELWNN